MSIKIRTSSEAVALLPYLLGFVPGESIAMLLTRTGSPVVAARMDLPKTVGDFAATMQTTPLPQHDRAIVTVRSDDELVANEVAGWVWQCWPNPAAVQSLSVTPVGSVAVDGQGIPLAGRTSHEADASRIAAEAVLAGVPAPLASIDMLKGNVASVAWLVEATRGAIRTQRIVLHGKPHATRRADIIEYLSRWEVTHGRPLTTDDAAYLMAHVQDIDVRDAAWLAMTRDNARVMFTLWSHAAQHVDGPDALPVIALAGMAAWIGGDGAQARLAVERSQEIDPNYSMTQLLDSTLTAGVPPKTWDRMRDQAAAEPEHTDDWRR